MTNTIEEAAKRFADMKTTKQAGSSVERDKKALLMTQFFHYALEELPLSSRLTVEEKERVRKEYWQAARDWIGIGDARGYCRTCVTLESIFGADFFKEGE